MPLVGAVHCIWSGHSLDGSICQNLAIGGSGSFKPIVPSDESLADGYLGGRTCNLIEGTGVNLILYSLGDEFHR